MKEEILKEEIAYPKSGYSYISSRYDMSISNITRISSFSPLKSKKRRLKTTNQYIGEIPIFTSPWNNENIIPDIIQLDDKKLNDNNENDMKLNKKQTKESSKDDKKVDSKENNDYKSSHNKNESKYDNDYDDYYSDDDKSYKKTNYNSSKSSK